MRMLRPVIVGLAVICLGAAVARAAAEETNPAALAAALKDTAVTLQDGLKASEREGTPISGKFEIEDGKLQLSIYTMKGAEFAEVIVDLKSGAIAKAEKITDAGDLKDAAAQKAAMAGATQSLLVAVDTAAKSTAGLRAVSIKPELKGGHPVGEVALLEGTALKKVAVKLD